MLPAPCPACSVSRAAKRSVPSEPCSAALVLQRQLLTPSDRNCLSRPDGEHELSEGQQVLGPAQQEVGMRVFLPGGGQRLAGWLGDFSRLLGLFYSFLSVAS